MRPIGFALAWHGPQLWLPSRQSVARLARTSFQISVSAICGLVHRDGRPVPRGTIAQMSAALMHRGPDASGEWCDGSAAIAHRALCTTTDSVTDSQPVIRTQDGIVVVADARIDNRSELRALLGSAVSALASDCEIIAAAYSRWGHDCVQRLIGDFAFVVWSARDRELFCARDPMGVRPFYYLATDRLFAFGSELKAILTIPGVQATIDEEQVALFLGWSQDDRSRTIFRELMRLPAGHTLVVRQDSIRLTRYWSPESAPDVRFASDDGYVEAFRDRFSAAVSARLRGAEPIGATLSGGLSSLSIVSMSRQLRGADASPILPFSLVFPSLPEKDLRIIDERRFVDARS